MNDNPPTVEIKTQDIWAAFCVCGVLLDPRVNPGHRCLSTCPREPITKEKK